MVFTKEALDRRLQAIREKKKESDMYRKGPQDYEGFMPATMRYNPDDPSLVLSSIESVGRMGPNATNIEMVKQQNLRDMLMRQKAAEELERAKEYFEKAQRPIKIDQKTPGEITVVRGKLRDVSRPRQLRPNKPMRPNGQPNAPVAPPGTQRDFNKKRWGRDGVPETSDIKNKEPWEGKYGKLVSVNWRGKRFVVNGKVAPIFVALLDDLWKAGYRPKSIGGYNDRNIAGTNTKSLHSYGYAIDIDPVQNPVQANDGSMQHILPPNVRALAAKYGLSWGGNWQSYKDPMHFSMPYGGRE